MSSEDVTEADKEWVCRPLDSYVELVAWVAEPPAWRALCDPLRERGEWALRNADVHDGAPEPPPGMARAFCHVEREQDEPPRRRRAELPRTLFCHDMANGYHDDSYINGTSRYDAYTFCEWSGIDIFCYFSHHFVTIPPLGWINIGHMHGVKVIGTVVTEWAQGSAIWDDLLSSEKKSETFASALVSVAATLKFDGWLLNIENQVSAPDKLVSWVRRLHSLLHAVLPHGTLIWYDSVTAKGDLVWQNELNGHNRVYFDACDGIFTNYSWRPEQVVASAEAAGSRRLDVYVGCDVWGRNQYGGGEFNTSQAVSVARAAGVSVAVFAAAWTHEAAAGGEEGEGGSPALSHCLLRERALWGSLWPLLSCALPHRLPYRTAFCRGQGHRRYHYGEVVSVSPWYNLRHQQPQPNARLGPHGYLLITRDEARPALSSRDKPQVAVEDSPVTSALDDDKAEAPSWRDRLRSSSRLARLQKSWIKFWPFTDSRKRVQPPPQAELGSERRRESKVDAPATIHLDNRDRRRYQLVAVAEEFPCIESYWRDAFFGGSCVRLNPCDVSASTLRTVRVLHVQWTVTATLLACVVTKPLPPTAHTLRLELGGRDTRGNPLRVVLSERRVGAVDAEEDGYVRYQYPCVGTELRDVQRHLLLHCPDLYVPIENRYGWTVRYYSVAMSAGSRVMSVRARCDGALLLGYLAFADTGTDGTGTITGQSPKEQN